MLNEKFFRDFVHLNIPLNSKKHQTQIVNFEGKCMRNLGNWMFLYVSGSNPTVTFAKSWLAALEYEIESFSLFLNDGELEKKEEIDSFHSNKTGNGRLSG